MKKPLLFGIILTVCVVIVAFVFAQVYPVGMISYWKFDEVSGTTAFDSVDANDGIIYGATWTTGIVSDALSFDGVNDYVEGQYISGDGPRIGTIEGWVNIYSYPTRYRYGIIAAAVGGQNICSFTDIVELQPDGKLSFYLWGNGTIFRPVSETVLNLNEWYHVAVTVDGINSKIYINGNLEASIPSPYGARHGGLSKFIFSNVNSCWGYGYSHDAFHGALDEVAIYNRALTPEEVFQHYLNGLAGRGYTAIDTLIAQIMDLDLSKGTENSLISKLDNALDSLERGNDNAAIGKLNAFINQVRAQKGKKIQNSDADMLIDGAEEIINAIQGKINGEINFDLEILFNSPSGTTIANANGLTYIFGDEQYLDSTLNYAEEYWGEYPLYYPGNNAAIFVYVTYNGPDDQVNVSVVTETYAIELDGSNGAPIDGPNTTDLTFNKGETKLVDSSFILPSNHKGLNRFIVKVYINGTLLMTEEAIFCPPDIAQ